MQRIIKKKLRIAFRGVVNHTLRPLDFEVTNMKTAWGVLAHKWILAFAIFTLYEDTVTATLGTPEQRLRHDLLDEYHPDVRPVLRPDDVVNVSFSYKLTRIVSVNTKSQVLTTDAGIVQVWTNPFLRWNETEYEGIQTLHMSPSSIWVPDIVLYNNADEDVSLSGSREKFKTSVIVNSDGLNIWMSPATFKSSCDMVIKYYPFDRQTCRLTFGSWTFDTRLLNIVHRNKPDLKSGKFIESGDWDLADETIESIHKIFDCCKHSFSLVTYTYQFERKSLYYVMYQIIPCVFMVLLAVLNFVTPPESGERISFCITILLSMSVYLLILANSLPETSDDVAMLGVYYMVTIILVALSLVGTVVVLRCHFADNKPADRLVKLAKFVLRRNSVRVPRVSETPAIPDDERNDASVLLSEIKKPNVDEFRDSALALIAQNIRDQKEQNEWKDAWKEIAEAVDRFLLVLFVFVTVTITAVIWFQRP